MTLNIQYGYKDSFILLTSDTMKIKKYFNAFSLKPSGNYGEQVETKEKIIKVSDYVYGNIGGILSICHKYTTRLLDRVKPGDYLEDVSKHLKEVVNEVREEEFERFFLKYNTTNEYAIQLIGFYKDGTTGLLEVVRGEVTEISSLNVTNRVIGNMFAPTQEILNMMDKVFDYYHLLPTSKDHLEAALKHFAQVQAKISVTHPKFVSSTMIYQVLAKIDKQIVSFEGEVDLSGIVEQLKEHL